jgi:hypothetical protein
MASISDGRKRKRGRPRVDAVAITVRTPPAEVAALDTAIAAEGGRLSRPAMMRRIVVEWLRERGFLHHER